MDRMETLTKDRTRDGANRESSSSRFCAGYAKSLWLLLLTGAMVLSGCGGGGSSSTVPINATLSGNWQFTMAPPADGSYLGGLQGGFLLQTNGSATGAATYAVSLPQLPYPCNSGSAAITGTMVSPNTWNLTAVAGTQTFTLNGTMSLDGLTIAGTYTSTAGTSGDGGPCGTLQTVPMQWTATLVPPLTGSVQGSFHSAGGAAGLNEQDFLVSGALIQAPNTGATAAVTGNLTFLNALTQESDYPCFTAASLYGQISGNSVALTITASDGTEWGLIGEPVGSLGATGVNPVTYDLVHGGYILHGAGPSYSVATTACPGSLGNIDAAGDFGNICLSVGGGSACQQPITLTPSALTFPNQAIGSPPTSQTITLANASGTILSGVTVNLANNSGAANYTETDDCGLNGLPSQGLPFDLAPGQSCDITVLFAPLETCAVGTPPAQCPSPLTATLAVTDPNAEMIFTAPITGTGFSQGALFSPQLDFGAEGVTEASLLQVLPFTNRSKRPVQTVANSANLTLQDEGDHAEID